MKKIFCILYTIGLILILLSCGAEEAAAAPAFEVGCYANAAKGYADISAPLPTGWQYSVIEETDEGGNEIFGICFWPNEHPELFVYIGWRPGMTHPDSTGAGTLTKLSLPDGSILWHHTRRQGEDAQSVTISWDEYPYLYLAEYLLPDALEAEYEPIIRESLSFTEFGGIQSMYEARDLVTAQLDKSVALAGFQDFDLSTGAWCIFVDETEGAPRRYFHVSGDGVIREYFAEDQPLGGTEIVFRESEETQ